MGTSTLYGMTSKLWLIEAPSPANTLAELAGRDRAISGRREFKAWIVHPRPKRVEFHDASGDGWASAFQVDLSTLLD